MKDPHWKIDGDPIRTARVHFNRDSGLIEVVGQLRITLFDGTGERSAYSAPYKAQLFSTSRTSLKVLKISMSG